MRNIFIFMLACLALSLASCKSCNGDPGKTDAGAVDSGVDVVDEPLPPEFTTIEGDVWSIDLPYPWYKGKDPIASMADLLAINNPKELALVLLTLKYEGTFDQFSIERVRELRGAGYALANVAVVTFGCSKFTLIDAVKDGVQGYMWITVDETRQLAFDVSCGGETSNRNDIFGECLKVVKSFRIKGKQECHLR